MTDQPQQTNPNDHRYYPEDEIELMDYLLVIWKWKYLIIAGTFGFALVAAIISFIAFKQQPTMYRTSVVLKSGVLKINKEGKKVFVDTPEKIKALIENELKFKVLEEIKVSNNTNLSTSIDFQVVIPSGSKAISVSFLSIVADEGTTKLNYLIKSLFAEYANNAKSIQEGFEKNIEAKKYELDELSFKEKGIKAKTKKYQQELSEIEANIKLLRESKDNSQSKEYFLNKLSIENDYRNTFQKYFELNENAKYNLYKIQKVIINVLKEIENLEKGENNVPNDSNYGKKISYTQKSIAKNSKEIEKLEKKKLNIQSIQILQPPVTTELPKINKIKRNVSISSLVGILLMLFLSFFLEYLSSYQIRKSNR